MTQSGYSYIRISAFLNITDADTVSRMFGGSVTSRPGNKRQWYLAAGGSIRDVADLLAATADSAQKMRQATFDTATAVELADILRGYGEITYGKHRQIYVDEFVHRFGRSARIRDIVGLWEV